MSVDGKNSLSSAIFPIDGVRTVYSLSPNWLEECRCQCPLISRIHSLPICFPYWEGIPWRHRKPKIFKLKVFGNFADRRLMGRNCEIFQWMRVFLYLW